MEKGNLGIYDFGKWSNEKELLEVQTGKRSSFLRGNPWATGGKVLETNTNEGMNLDTSL